VSDASIDHRHHPSLGCSEAATGHRDDVVAASGRPCEAGWATTAASYQSIDHRRLGAATDAIGVIGCSHRDVVGSGSTINAIVVVVSFGFLGSMKAAW